MRTMMIVTADTNDEDFVYEITDNVSKEDIHKIKNILHILMNSDSPKKSWGHNWMMGELVEQGMSPQKMYEGELTKEEIDWFEEFLPYGEYGIHSIESVRFLEVESDETIRL